MATRNDDKPQDAPKADTTVASESTVADAGNASATADADRVAVVSRDKNGDPDQSANYEVLYPEDVDAPAAPAFSDRELHDNKPGEQLGAKNVTKRDK